jgi:hypothetical protein
MPTDPAPRGLWGSLLLGVAVSFGVGLLAGLLVLASVWLGG